MKLEALCNTLLQNRWYCTTINKFREFSIAPQQAPLREKFVRIMRLTVILFLICAHVSANGLSQKVTLKANKLPLTQVFNTIKQQTGYSFFWDQQLLDKAPLISVSMQDASIEQALANCLKGLNLSYEIKGKIVMITEKKVKPDLQAAAEAYAQAPAYYTISGVITDDKGEPMQAVTVKLSPLNMTAVTNAKGEYIFKDVPPSHYTMEISYIGYTTTQKNFIIVDKSIVISTRLQPAANEQEEVVLSTGYQKLKKNTVTGSFSIISSKDIQATPSPNLMERLEGKVPGVLFDTRRNKITVRGVNTYGGADLGNSTDPLIVIDGYPYIDNQLTNISASQLVSGSTSGSLNPIRKNQPVYSGVSILSSFNPEDIESITFLKDAAAAAIWGSLAANGVIVIETKKGRKNSPLTVNLSATYSTSKPASVANINAMNSRDYINLEQELFDKNYYTDPSSNYRYANVSEAVNTMFRAKRGEITTAQRDAELNALANMNNAGQLQDYLLQRVKSQQYNLSISGGSDNSSYHLSGGYMKNNPVYKSNSAENYFLNSNLTNEFLNKRLVLNTILNYTYSKSSMNTAALLGLGNGTTGLAPYQMLVDANGTLIQRSIFFTPRVTDSLTQKLGHMSWTYNPIDELNYNNTILAKNSFRANINLTGKITDWLNVQVGGQLQKNIEQQDNLQDLNSYETRQLVNIGSTYASGRLSNNFPKGGIYKTANTTADDYTLRAQINANKNFGGDHQFSALAGAEIRESKSMGYKQTRYGYDPISSTSVTVNPTVGYATMYGYTSTIGYSDGTIYKSRKRYLSYFSNASYTYRGKYSLSASARFDDFTLVGVRRKQRGTPLWSVGGRWDVSKENFMKNLKWVNSLGIRTSYGTSGVASQFATAYTVITGSVDGYTQLPIATINSFANPTLTWQTTKIYNAGFDATLFNNRLNVGFDIYTKKTENILANLPYNPTFGFSTVTYNTGNMSAHGLELNLTGDVLRGKDWKWMSNFNFSYNTNKITDNRYPISETTSPAARIATTGYATDALWVYRWAGLDPATGQSRIYNSKDAIVNSAGFPSLYAADQVYVGRTTPPYFGGFTNTFQYKNWSLSGRITYQLGHKFLRANLQQSNYPTGAQAPGRLSTNKILVTRWMKPGDEAITDVPGISNANSNAVSFYNGSDINVRDAGNIRFQQLTLGYMLPQATIKKLSVFKSAAINLTASNLGIIWRKNKEGIDPDYITTDTYNNLPPTVNYVVNLNLGF